MAVGDLRGDELRNWGQSADEVSIIDPQAAPRRRIILLGASNLSRSFEQVLETALHVWGSPLEVFAATGHGRSYGMTNRVLGRTLPGILQCGLWQALEEAPPAPTAALITDIGNDLLYGVEPETILSWVAESYARLVPLSDRIVLTALPIASTAAMTNWFYLVLRTCTYPKCRLSRAVVLERAARLNDGLKKFASERGATCVELDALWYGIDPIHLRRSAWRKAWSTILSSWSDTPMLAPPARRSVKRWLYFRLLAPERKWHFGREFRASQPAGRLDCGTTIALF